VIAFNAVGCCRRHIHTPFLLVHLHCTTTTRHDINDIT
jgi:hypothetical protein